MFSIHFYMIVFNSDFFSRSNFSNFYYGNLNGSLEIVNKVTSTLQYANNSNVYELSTLIGLR